MNLEPDDLVVAALRDPDLVKTWSADRCGRLVRQARAAGLLGRLAPGHDADAPLAAWHASATGHVESARRVTRAQHAEIWREVAHIQRALSSLGAPVVLLKGAAYVVAGLPAASGRVFSDIDILVPRDAIGRAESLLMLAGWMTTKQNEYDQRYYRRWMHELPPMEHVHRKTTIDVHHAILPLTARLRPDSGLLLADAVAVPGWTGLFVLSSLDMVLHAATHLFMNDDMSHALRDLSDIDLLLRHFGTTPDFWQRLPARAAALDLGRPLHYALRQAQRIFDTPVPLSCGRALRLHGPPAYLERQMDWIWRQTIRSPGPHAGSSQRAIALLALYIRGHWLRMPPWMLLRHLTVKALRLHERTPRDTRSSAIR